MISFIVYLLLSYYTLCSAYLLVVTLSSFFHHKRQGAEVVAVPIVAVIPAHNEEGQVREAILSLKKTNYPQDKLQIIVLADNCTDQTAEQARQYGVIALERKDLENRGKGAALHWFFTEHQKVYQNAEIITVVDADTLVAPNFLTELALSFSDPDVQVVQGFYTVSNPGDSWLTALATAALAIVHDMRPAGREALGASVGLKGNGMAFRSGLVRQHGWPCNSVVEDLEYSLFLMEKGVRIHYNPDAIVYGEMPTSKRQAAPQRRRWEEGRFRIASRMIKRMLLQFVMRLQLRYLDAVVDLLVPPLSILAALGALLLSTTALGLPEFFWQTASATGALFLYVILGIARQKPPVYVWLALLAAPLFVLFKLGIYAKILLQNRKPAWVRTRRNKES